MTDASGSTTYCYDRRGNVLKKTQVTNGVSLVTQYTYTVADRLATITYPSGALVTYTRDALGRVATVLRSATVGTKNTTLISNASYLPFGPLNVLTYGNGRTQTKNYDQDYAISNISGTPSPGNALTLYLGVDVMGDIVSAKETLSIHPDRVYDYDPLYRLTGATTGGTPPAPLEETQGSGLRKRRGRSSIVALAAVCSCHGSTHPPRIRWCAVSRDSAWGSS
jgi:YD repeat-containing protein